MTPKQVPPVLDLPKNGRLRCQSQRDHLTAVSVESQWHIGSALSVRFRAQACQLTSTETCM